MRYFLLMIVAVALAGCDHFDEDQAAAAADTKANARQVGSNWEKNAVAVADTVRDNVKQTAEQLRTWWITPLPAKPGPRPVASSYCYYALQDILCYRQPMPGWEYRMVGYQGTDALPPAQAVMTPLPSRPVDKRMLPESRIAAAKPVFSRIPEGSQEKKNPDEGGQPLVVDPAHETLPNPALAPEL